MDVDYENIENEINLYGDYYPDDYIEDEAPILEEPDMDFFEDFDNTLSDIDFSDIQGRDFKKSFSKVNRKMALKRKVIVPENREVIVEGRHGDFETPLPKTGQRVIVPETRKVIVEGRKQPQSPKRPAAVKRPQVAKRPQSSKQPQPRVKPQPRIKPPHLTKDIPVRKGGTYAIASKRRKSTEKIIIPSDKKVIVEGVSKFILSQDRKADIVKNIGYYKGERLKELVLTFNNNSAVDFELELFNPSMPLDYLYSTGLNLNDKIQVAGGEVSYSDVVFNLLANSALIPNCKFVFAGPQVTEQKSQPLILKNKTIEGKQKLHPLNLDLQIDTMQVAQDIVFFDIMDMLDRPFIPDGMDVIKYKVLAGNTVTMGFFYKQVSLKKVFYKEARNSKKLM